MADVAYLFKCIKKASNLLIWEPNVDDKTGKGEEERVDGMEEFS